MPPSASRRREIINEKETPQSRVQKPYMAHKAFLVDIHGDFTTIRVRMDDTTRLGI